MSGPALLSRRRADAFARALDGEPVGSPDIAALAALAARIPPAPVEMDGVAREATRRRLLAVATVGAGVPDRRPAHRPGWRRQRRLAPLAAAAAFALIVVGVGVSASRSLPGQPFYALKQASESLQLDLASGGLAKGRLETEFARTRLAELRRLTRPADARAAGFELRQISADTGAARGYLTAYYRASRDPQALRLLAAYAGYERAGLVSLRAGLPPPVRPALDRVLAQLAGVGAAARTALAGAAAPGPASGPAPAPARTSAPATGPAGGTTPAPSVSGQPAAGTPTPAGTTPPPSPGAGLLPSLQPGQLVSPNPLSSTSANPLSPLLPTSTAPNPLSSLLSPLSTGSLLP